MTPYTTRRTATGGGVQIGLLYQPAPPPIYGHALALQTALLDKRTRHPLRGLWRLLGTIWSVL